MPDVPELPPFASEPISLILYAHNAGNDGALLSAWQTQLQARAIPFEIIVLDDGSSPSLEVAPDIRLVRHEQPRGVGACLRSGIEVTTHPLIVFAPLHPDYRPERLASFLAEIDKVHFLSGYRAREPVPFLPKLMGMTWRLLCRLLFSYSPDKLPGWLGWKTHLRSFKNRMKFGVRLVDQECPYRMFRREVLARSPIQSEGTFSLVEQMAKVNFAGHLLGHEIPLPEATPTLPFPGQPVGATRVESRRLFSRPDFGPTVLATDTASLTANLTLSDMGLTPGPVDPLEGQGEARTTEP